MTAYIYGLSDPLTKEVRYIGKTNDLHKRYLRHLSRSQRETNHRACWIKHLLNNGVKPEMFIVETVKDDDWQEAERFWLIQFRVAGARLVNTTDGGTGGKTCDWRGRKHTEETRKKMLAAQAKRKGIPFSETIREKLRHSRRGRKPALGMIHTDESKQKIAQANRDRSKRVGYCPRTGVALENIRNGQRERREREFLEKCNGTRSV
jgi:group I intron endonuclease